MSERGEAASNTMPAVYSAPLFSYREENTGRVVSLLSSGSRGDYSATIRHVGKKEIRSPSQMLPRTRSTKYVRNVFIEY